MSFDETEIKNRWSQTKLHEFVAGLTNEEQVALTGWLTELLKIKASKTTRKQKLNQISALLKKSIPLLPVIKHLANETKRIVWEERKGGFRSFIAGSAFAIFLFGFQGAGIAAFGTAVGLPLWVIFGGGSTLAYSLLNELRKDK